MPDKSPQKKNESSDLPLHSQTEAGGHENAAPENAAADEDSTMQISTEIDSELLIACDYLIDSKYRVIKVIGKGGMGTVYRVEQIFLRKQFALKTIKGEFNDSSWRRFQTEAVAASKLNHPNIVKVSDFGLIENKHPYCVMELVEGETLADYLRRCARLPYDDIFDIFIPLCLALQDAHEMGIVHRDVKPSNIMLIGKQGNWQCKLLDFGIAKINEGDISALTQTGELIGSPLYMSPEQCGAGKVDARSDIYSLGCTLFEAITACPPFSGSSAIETIGKHLNEKPPSLKEASMGRDFPPDLERVVHTMLAKSPEERFSSAKHVAENLMRLKQGEDLRLSTSLTDTKKSRIPLSTLLLGSLALAAAGFALYFWSQSMQLKEDRSSREVEITKQMQAKDEMIQSLMQKQKDTANASAKAVQWKPSVVDTIADDGFRTELDKKTHAQAGDTNGVCYQHTIYANGQKVRCFEFPPQSLGKLLDESTGTKYRAAGSVQIPWHGPLLFYPDASVLINFPGLFDKFQPDEIRAIVFEKGKDFYYNPLRNLTHYRLLEEISFEDTDFDDTGFKYLEEIPHLVSLNFLTTNITSEGLSKYSRLKKLRKLCISEMPSVTGLLKTLQGDSELDVLQLRYCSLKEKDYDLLAKLPKLHRLHLDILTPIKPEVFAGLSHSKSLRWLDMQHAFIAQESFPSLAKMQQLKVFFLTGNKYTPEQQVQIKRLLPKCDVFFNP